MSGYFSVVRDFLNELGVTIDRQDDAATLFIVSDESRGITNLIVDCEDDLLVIEQVIMESSAGGAEVYKRLLQMNRELVHGAFCLDEDGQRVIFRDTLQLANLDLNELEASINALSVGLVDFADELIAFAQGAAA
ncbi:YbjN domain-containing protein [Magnetofaba australis]|uniref:Putative bacterial sensory transduction regulator, YbjN superfamily n=1 Tax=Magnetofaba australis IT-1 TaxID=1434232 RepID=A0A1Y2K8R9_9PROT|nr:YbjN domain-containing protein [Magnetofaba australis]OSM07150.1 putative bacterial sensory transduction regulator, YbjN superfamily [Magnetofaba australis IT-1]